MDQFKGEDDELWIYTVGGVWAGGSHDSCTTCGSGMQCRRWTASVGLQVLCVFEIVVRLWFSRENVWNKKKKKWAKVAGRRKGDWRVRLSELSFWQGLGHKVAKPAAKQNEVLDWMGVQWQRKWNTKKKPREQRGGPDSHLACVCSLLAFSFCQIFRPTMWKESGSEVQGKKSNHE